jgi:hypothetical protein
LSSHRFEPDLIWFSAAAAAKINAQLQAKKGIQHVDVPPIRSVSNVWFQQLWPSSSLRVTNRLQASSPSARSGSAGPQPNSAKLDDGIYIADGDYIKDIEVNDLRNRYTLTKGSTQKMVNKHSCHIC